MKCHSCGGELHIDNEKCPYCGCNNPHYQRHRLAMKKYQSDYETVKSNVYGRTGAFMRRNARITVIAVLALLNVVMLALYINVWDIYYYFEGQSVKRNAQIHREALAQLESEKDYFALAAYYDAHNLDYVDALDEYRKVCAMSRTYYQVYRGLTELGEEDPYRSTERRIQTLCEEIEYMYRYSQQADYDRPECFRREHVEAMEDIKKNVEALLITYGNVTEEEAAGFEQLSNAQKQLALERGIGGYEE